MQRKRGKKYDVSSAFATMLEQTFKAWLKNCLDLLQNKLSSPMLSQNEKEGIKEDLKFLKSMSTDRVASYGVKDAIFKMKAVKRMKREKENIKRKDKNELHKNPPSKQPYIPSDSCSSSTEDDEYVPPKRQQKTKCGTSLFLPEDARRQISNKAKM